MDLDEWESVSDDGYFEMEYLYPSPPRKQNQLVPLQIPLELKIGNTSKDVLLKDITKNQSFVDDQEENVSQVFFKIKENEFVDMKIESPKSSSSKEIVTSPRMVIEKDVFGKKEDSSWEEENNSGFSLWKWSLSGVGAICTFGVVAASICVVYFGSQQRKKLQQDKKIMFQIYADDKRIKQVVQHATKLNEAISAVRGVPITRAHITVGGNYDVFD
ncbi:unnamed protein product [Lathyrus oleraceus]|uniref:DUF6821 domain-containing protein n=1 Tax=Pisum sativum TaxID=3888 RepID=A0A9D5BHD1_PEA|nr:uncharacterized protein LOC127125900 [Pisum sativum]KAI5443680.1 hypothetical protein KIW84_012363 [Pisum sativum]